MSVLRQNQLIGQPTEPTITIRRQWNDWRKATVRLGNISGLHWDDVSGGVRAHSPRDFLHGYIWCSDIIDGEVSHSCRHGNGLHNIKVCITKVDNTKAEYAAALAKFELETNAQLEREAKHAPS